MQTYICRYKLAEMTPCTTCRSVWLLLHEQGDKCCMDHSGCTLERVAALKCNVLYLVMLGTTVASELV